MNKFKDINKPIAFLQGKAWLLVAGGLCLGGCLGGCLGCFGFELFSKGGRQEEASSGVNSAERRLAGRPHTLEERVPPVLNGDIARIAAISRLADRHHALRDYLESIPMEEFHTVLAELDDWMRHHMAMFDPEAPSIAYIAYETVAEVMVERNPQLAMSYLVARLSLPDTPGLKNPDELPRLVGIVFRKWATQDPQGALKYIVEYGKELMAVDQTLTSRLSHDLAKMWVKEDPQAALAWMNRQGAGFRKSLVRHSLGFLQQSNPELAIEVLNTFKDRELKNALSLDIARIWTGVAPEKAFDWSKGLEDGTAGKAVSMVLRKWAEEDYEAAYLAFGGLTGSSRELAVQSLVEYHWAYRGDYPAAAEILESELGSSTHVDAVQDLISNWGQNDPERAASWLEDNLTNDGVFDGAIEQLVGQLNESHPEAAVLWSTYISDGEQRTEQLASAVENWFENSPGEALDWIEGSDRLEDEDRLNLAERFPGFIVTDSLK